MFTEIEAHRDAVTWQPSLLAIDEPDFDPDARRRRAGGSSAAARGSTWCPGWVTGADVLFDTVLESAPWKAFERPMYDRVVDVPRLETRVWHDRPQVLDRMAAASGAATASAPVDLRQPLPRRARLRRVARRPHRRHARRRGGGDPVARLDAHAAAAPRRRRPVHRRSRCTPATCSCRAAPASAPSSTASPSAPTPAPASASCSARRAGTERRPVVPRRGRSSRARCGLLERPARPRRDVLLVVEDEPEAEGVQVDALGEGHVVARQLVDLALELDQARRRRSRRST